MALGLDRALGDLFVGDLGAAGERRDVAHALGEGADEGGPRCCLGGGEEGAGVLGADVVLQLGALGQHGVASPAATLVTSTPRKPAKGTAWVIPCAIASKSHRRTLIRSGAMPT